MATQKYCYVIVRKENGLMLPIQDSKLPIYWSRKVAIDVCLKIGGYAVNKYTVHKLLLSDIQTMILNSKKAI